VFLLYIYVHAAMMFLQYLWYAVTAFTTLSRPGTNTNWLDLAVKWSKVKVLANMLKMSILGLTSEWRHNLVDTRYCVSNV